MTFPEYHVGDLVAVEMADTGRREVFIVASEPTAKDDGTIMLNLIPDPFDREERP